jgi:hypothetical protein
MRIQTALVKLAFSVAITTLLPGAAMAAAPVYTIQGFAPGTALETFEGVNSSGLIVGDSGNGGKGTFADGVVTDLHRSGGGYSGMTFINDLGDVAMTQRDLSAPHGSVASLFVDGKRTRLTKLGTAAGINSKRQVVGLDSEFSRPIIYDNGVYRRLRPLKKDQASMPQGINDDGVVVGIDGVGTKSRPALWDAAGEPHYLGSVSKLGYGTARAINNLGQVVGCTDVIGCYVYEAGNFHQLPPAGGLGWIDVRGISSNGIVLGMATASDDVVYCNGESHVLEDLIAGDEHGHWELWAWAIGPAGHIVGSGKRDGMPMWFLATLASACSAD